MSDVAVDFQTVLCALVVAMVQRDVAVAGSVVAKFPVDPEAEEELGPCRGPRYLDVCAWLPENSTIQFLCLLFSLDIVKADGI